jgi:predicted small lipoprotein YifL
MRKNAAHLWLVPALAMALAGCGGKTPDEVEPNIPPTAFKQEILSTLGKTLDDPTNARDAFISDPVLTQAGSGQRYTACVRFNARDINRTYSGSKDRIAYFYGGHLNQLVEATKEQCGNAAYKPFPELEKYCFATKCG